MDAIEEEKYFETEERTHSWRVGKSQNFQVVIRVRPPLPREQSDYVPFWSVIHIDKNHQSLSAMEYMGAEINELERQRDISENPHLIVWHHFTFDYVYDPYAT